MNSSPLRTDRFSFPLVYSLSTLLLSACQLIGPLERELYSPDEEQQTESATPTCLLKGEQGAPWWVGSWAVDKELLKVQLFEKLSTDTAHKQESSSQQGGRTDTITNVFIASLAEHLAIQVTDQQASLMQGGTWKRYPIAQLPRQAGVRLTSIDAQESSTLWCQGDRAYWSAEGGSPLPVKRSHTSVDSKKSLEEK